MKKKLLCLAMAVFMAVGMPVMAYANDYQGRDGWQVSFDGRNMNSNFTSQDLQDEAINIQPGDSIELKVQVRNTGSDSTDWYMSNEVVQSLEDAKKTASGGAYEYRLSYVDPSGAESILYNSETVGGEGAGASIGLHQATDSLEEYFYLGRLNQNQGGSVHLRVAIDGETQDNNYQRTLAEIQMRFAVERVRVGEEIIRNTTTTTTAPTTYRTTTTTAPVRTGDNTKLLRMSAVALASGVLLLILGVMVVKKRKGEKGERDA